MTSSQPLVAMVSQSSSSERPVASGDKSSFPVWISETRHKLSPFSRNQAFIVAVLYIRDKCSHLSFGTVCFVFFLNYYKDATILH